MPLNPYRNIRVNIHLLLPCLLLLAGQVLHAQDTLPRFNVSTRGNNRVLINWSNNYPVVNQISIQRSFDSTRNFKTILTVPDPSIPQNGFVDTKAATPFMFYRLFIVLDSGKYVFTVSQRPFWDTAQKIVAAPPRTRVDSSGFGRIEDKPELPATDSASRPAKEPEKAAPPKPERFFYVMKRDSLIRRLAEHEFTPFRDSLLYKTKDTLLFASVDTMVIRPFIPKPVFKPSLYVYTARDGNVNIALPEAIHKEFQIKFFEDDDTPLFELKQIRESMLILDKVNFLHAGWFKFELYENGKLVEKNKFFIARDN